MIALPEHIEQLRSSKYKVWHGKSAEAISKLEELKNDLTSKDYIDSKIERVRSIISYLSNNLDKLVNYMTRKNNNLPYTSNVAEDNVESQINARFKRKQKMQWNRQNAHNVLQLRSTIYSDEWTKYQSNVDLRLAA